MNLKLVYVSVLMFGIMGLFLFMYLQDWIEEQHTGKITNKLAKSISAVQWKNKQWHGLVICTHTV